MNKEDFIKQFNYAENSIIFINSVKDFLTPIAESGSSRQNFIVNFKNSNEKQILTFNENIQENLSFIYFSDIFSKLNLNTPKILATSQDKKAYLQSFLGEQTFNEIIHTEKNNTEKIEFISKNILKNLFILQNKTKKNIDYSKTFEYEIYNENPILHDLFYFKFMMVDILEIQYQKSKLITEFKNLTEKIASLSPKGLILRDFQSRNIIINQENQDFFIDYQSAMKGPLLYDVVSFLYQAKANFSKNFKEKMLHFYINLWEDKEIQQKLEESLPYILIIRTMQVLGAYGFRGLIQRKKHFMESIENGIKNLTHTFENWTEKNNYPEINNIIKNLNTEEIKNKINKIKNHQF